MHPERILPALPALVDEHLGADDDQKLWQELFRVVAEDASVLLVKDRSSLLYATAGTCSHWLRPHQSRWTAAGGFALPVGYGDGEGFLRGLPNLDWSVILQFDHTHTLGLVLSKRQPSGSIPFGSPFHRERSATSKRPCTQSGPEGPCIQETSRSSTTDFESRKMAGNPLHAISKARPRAKRRDHSIANPTE
jgi:hypothetical protein